MVIIKFMFALQTQNRNVIRADLAEIFDNQESALTIVGAKI